MDVNGIELADAAEQQHAVDAGIGEMVEVPTPIVVVDAPVFLGDGDGWAEHPFEHGVAGHGFFLSTIW